jgi:hypothetical protein
MNIKDQEVIMNISRIKYLYCFVILMTGLLLSSGIDASESMVIDPDAPIYSPPNPSAAISRLEAGKTDSANRGVRVRGVRVRGVRVRSGNTRGSNALSSSLTEDLSGMFESDVKVKNKPESLPLSFPKRLAPIASEQTGFTSSSQPNLYWYISGQFKGEMEFKLNEPKVSQPILSIKLSGSPAEGIYGIKLKDYNVNLKPGIEYEWFITIITDPLERSGDIYASATIRYVEPSSELHDKFNMASIEQKYYVFAKNGYWYDSISSVSSLIEQFATTKKYRLHRAALLKQVNLTNAARYDLSLVNIP